MHHVNITLDTRTGGWIGEFFPDSSNIRIEQLWLAEYFILFYFFFLFCSTLNKILKNRRVSDFTYTTGLKIKTHLESGD